MFFFLVSCIYCFYTGGIINTHTYFMTGSCCKSSSCKELFYKLLKFCLLNSMFVVIDSCSKTGKCLKYQYLNPTDYTSFFTYLTTPEQELIQSMESEAQRMSGESKPSLPPQARILIENQRHFDQDFIQSNFCTKKN